LCEVGRLPLKAVALAPHNVQLLLSRRQLELQLPVRAVVCVTSAVCDNVGAGCA
jgi:hypothetical protein